jgi:hypothetical protein
MGVFADLFSAGNRPLARVSVIEAFAENPDTRFTAPEIIKMSGVSRRATYYIIENLVREGLLQKTTEKNGKKKVRSYSLNNGDLRAVVLKQTEALLAIGKIEAQIKMDNNIPLTETLPMSLLSRPAVSLMLLERPTISPMNELAVANYSLALPPARDHVQNETTILWGSTTEQMGWKTPEHPCM